MARRLPAPTNADYRRYFPSPARTHTLPRLPGLDNAGRAIYNDSIIPV